MRAEQPLCPPRPSALLIELRLPQHTPALRSFHGGAPAVGPQPLFLFEEFPTREECSGLFHQGQGIAFCVFHGVGLLEEDKRGVGINPDAILPWQSKAAGIVGGNEQGFFPFGGP